MKWRGLLEICPPGTHECDPVWRTSICRFHDVKLLRLSSSWTVQVGLNDHGRCLYERRKRRDAGGRGGGTEKAGGHRRTSRDLGLAASRQEHGGRPAAPQAGETRSGLSSESRWLLVADTLILDLGFLEPPIRSHLLGKPYDMNTTCIQVFILLPPPPGRQVPFHAVHLTSEKPVKQ